MSADRESLERVIGTAVSRETFVRLSTFEAEFLRWSQRINLAAPSTLSTIWDRHILDSAQLVPLSQGAIRWLDLGSGGGFPGAILAVLLAETPGASIDLVESAGKKAAFLRTTLARLGAPARVHADRIEHLYEIIPVPQIISARALASLAVLLRLAEPWLSRGARALFHKGRDYRTEIEESAAEWRFDLIEHPSVIEDGAAILEIARLERR